MNRNKGIIFDLDGVIVDTVKFHYQAWRKLANDLGFDITKDQNEELKGISRESSMEKVVKWGKIKLSRDQFLEQMAIKNENYLSSISTMSEKDILPGVSKILDHLRNNQIPVALGSASKNARIILEKLDLHRRFDAVVDGNDVSKAKPDPEVFFIAASILQIEPHNCIVFEDSQAGVQAANTAGMVSIGIGDKNILTQADYVFKDFSEIEIEFINQLLDI